MLHSYTGGKRENKYIKRITLADDEVLDKIPLYPGSHKIEVSIVGDSNLTAKLDTESTLVNDVSFTSQTASTTGSLIKSSTTAIAVSSTLSDTDAKLNLTLNPGTVRDDDVGLTIKNRLGAEVTLDVAIYSLERS